MNMKSLINFPLQDLYYKIIMSLPSVKMYDFHFSKYLYLFYIPVLYQANKNQHEVMTMTEIKEKNVDFIFLTGTV